MTARSHLSRMTIDIPEAEHVSTTIEKAQRIGEIRVSGRNVRKYTLIALSNLISKNSKKR